MLNLAQQSQMQFVPRLGLRILRRLFVSEAFGPGIAAAVRLRFARLVGKFPLSAADILMPKRDSPMMLVIVRLALDCLHRVSARHGFSGRAVDRIEVWFVRLIDDVTGEDL